MTIAWRLVKERHKDSAFDGEGARQFGGRWNHPGTRVVYLSDSLALAALETLVHLGRAVIGMVHVAFRVEIPDALTIITLDASNLPEGWRCEPPPDVSKQVGTNWAARGQSAVLRVPSVIVPPENNYALNPVHSDFGQLAISPPEVFHFDPRMWT